MYIVKRTRMTSRLVSLCVDEIDSCLYERSTDMFDVQGKTLGLSESAP